MHLYKIDNLIVYCLFCSFNILQIKNINRLEIKVENSHRESANRCWSGSIKICHKPISREDIFYKLITQQKKKRIKGLIVY